VPSCRSGAMCVSYPVVTSIVKKVNERLKTDIQRPELELSRGIYLCLNPGGSCEIIDVPGSGLLGRVWRQKALIRVFWTNRIGPPCRTESLESGPQDNLRTKARKGLRGIRNMRDEKHKLGFDIRFTLPESILDLGKPNACLCDSDV
jgi:hypothetical protein